MREMSKTYNGLTNVYGDRQEAVGYNKWQKIGEGPGAPVGEHVLVITTLLGRKPK